MRTLLFCTFLLVRICVIAQPAVNLKNKKCLSGNCENGIGKLSLPEMNNLVLEGKFSKGILNGEGKGWFKNSAGKEYMAEAGNYAGGYLKSGTVYNEAGTVISKGEYAYSASGKRFLKSGSVSIKYRGKEAKLVCTDMYPDEDGGDILTNGVVEIYEGYIGTEGRQLSQYTAKGENREGAAWEWDYENSLMHYLFYNKGVLSDTNVIKTIPDKKFVADKVTYLNPRDELFIYNIASGDFSFNGGQKHFIICNTGKGNLDFFKKDYPTYNVFDYSLRNGKTVRKTDEEINALANMFKRENNDDPNEKTSSKYKAADISACNSAIESLRNRAMYALSYYKAANQQERGYAGNRRAYEQSQNSIIPDCETAIAKYEGKVPSGMMNQLKDIRDALKGHNLPMGILRSMPVRRE